MISSTAVGQQIHAEVDPDFGYSDSLFNYSAYLQLSGNSYDGSGKYKADLNIYDGTQLLKTQTQDIGWLSVEQLLGKKTRSVSFGPFNFERDFGIKSIDNASYEFAFYRSDKQVARERFPGPQRIPYLMNPQKNMNIYFMQGFPFTASYKDLIGLEPSAHLEFCGPLNSSNSQCWTTSEAMSKAKGTVYEISFNEDFSNYREGANFTYRSSTITEG